MRVGEERRVGKEKESVSTGNKAPGSSHHGFHLKTGIKEFSLRADSTPLNTHSWILGSTPNPGLRKQFWNGHFDLRTQAINNVE